MADSVLTGGGYGGVSAPGPDIRDVRELPEAWRPRSADHARLSREPWSAAESEAAARAVRKGLEEVLTFFALRPTAAAALRDNAVQCLLDFSYAAENMPELQAAARAGARRALAELIRPYLARDRGQPIRGDLSPLLMYTGYAMQLFAPEDPRRVALVALCNAAGAECRSLTKVLGWDYRTVLAGPEPSVDALYELVLWSIILVETRCVPGLRLPAEAETLVADVWRFLADHPLVHASRPREGDTTPTFYDSAYLATHIAYIPTGCGRHRLQVPLAPWLYAFIRENFYSVLELGELDLAAEFVDVLRQYGCTAQNDIQVRAGTRFLMQLYHAAGDSWMAHRDGGECALDAYTLIHKPWTGAGGVRARTLQPIVPGTYGHAFLLAIGEAS